MSQNMMILLLVLLVGFYIFSNRPPKGVETIGVEELKEYQKKGALILDVRTPEEYRAGHIPGSKNQPVGPEFLAGLPKDKTKPIVVYCRSGKRAADAERQLLKRGYEQVYHFGSIGKWKEALD